MCCAPRAIVAANSPISRAPAERRPFPVVRPSVASGWGTAPHSIRRGPQIRHPSALARRQQRLVDLPEARDRSLAGVGIGAAHRVAQRGKDHAFALPAFPRPAEILLTPVAAPPPIRSAACSEKVSKYA